MIKYKNIERMVLGTTNVTVYSKIGLTNENGTIPTRTLH